MHDRSIAWMMAGGNRFETTEERLDRANLRALRAERRDAQPAMALRRAVAPIRGRALSAFGLAAASIAAPTTTPECCGA